MLGTAGRLIVLGLVVAGALSAGYLVRRRGLGAACERARSASWAVATFGLATWLAQVFIDTHVLAHPPLYAYAGSRDDPSGAIMLATGVAFLCGIGLLSRAGSGLLAFVCVTVLYACAVSFDTFFGSTPKNS